MIAPGATMELLTEIILTLKAEIADPGRTADEKFRRQTVDALTEIESRLQRLEQVSLPVSGPVPGLPELLGQTFGTPKSRD